MNTIQHAPSFVLHAALLGMLASPALGQSALVSNGSADPNTPALNLSSHSLSGVTAPIGAWWSEAATSGGQADAVIGFSAHAAGSTSAYRFADDFTVPAGTGWSLSRVSLFAYQPAAISSPFTSANVRLWQGRPGEASSFVIAGDAVTNRLLSASPTDIYRIPSSTIGPFPATPDTSRRLWRLELDLANTYLAPGQYWIDWQISTGGNGECYLPQVTLTNTRSQAGWNARQYRPVGTTTGEWMDAIDTGKPGSAPDVAKDIPFILFGGPGCPADVDDGTFTGTPDGGITIDDLLYYIDIFEQGVARADLDDGTGTGTRDGGVTIDDLLFMIQHFEEGC
jgi:hypothetical protein